jgi:hypothetical protein
MTEQRAEDLAELREVLAAYCDVNVSEGRDRLRAAVRRSPQPPFVSSFRHGLEVALAQDTISPAELSGLTHERFDDQTQVQAFLRELWDDLFGGRTVEGAEFA